MSLFLATKHLVAGKTDSQFMVFTWQVLKFFMYSRGISTIFTSINVILHGTYKHSMRCGDTQQTSVLFIFGNVFFFLLIILCLHCSRLQQPFAISNTVKLVQLSTAKVSTVCWSTWLHLALVGTWMLKKTTSWNYLSASSYSVFIVLAGCLAAARHPGCCYWLRRLVAAAPPLATSLSAFPWAPSVPSLIVILVLPTWQQYQ